MVIRIFTALGKKPRLLTLPLPVMKFGITVIKLIPRYRGITFGMIARMNQDMVFEFIEAERDFSFKPRKFILETKDLPI